MTNIIDLRELRSAYKPADSVECDFRESNTGLVGNEFIASGKDTIARRIIALSNGLYSFVPSSKTRTARCGEGLGVDFVHRSIKDSVDEVKKGNFVEWEPLRGDRVDLDDWDEFRDAQINGTHIDEIRACVQSGQRPLKDVEASGQVALRDIDPDIKAIFPLPDLEHWDRMIQRREAVPGKNLAAFLRGDIKPSKMKKYLRGGGTEELLDNKRADIKKRLEVSAGQGELVWRLGLHTDPNTLFIVNRIDSVRNALAHTAALSLLFLKGGQKIPHIISPQCLKGDEVLTYLGDAYEIANRLLDQAA
jgi:guanylate kinase